MTMNSLLESAMFSNISMGVSEELVKETVSRVDKYYAKLHNITEASVCT